MIKNPFSAFHEIVYPKLKIDITHQLLKEGLSQQRIAKALNITQPQVSYYTKKKVILDPALKEFSRELVQLILHNADENTLAQTICKRSLEYAKSGKLCEYCGIENCTTCVNVPSFTADYAAVLEHLRLAAELLSQYNPIHLMPQVRMNIAEAIPHPKSLNDIASFPGRITLIQGKITVISAPAFKASKHLPQLLLQAHAINPNLCAVMNIKYITTNKLTSKEYAHKKSSKQHLDKMDKNTDALNDKGGIGIEPCTYVFGRNALDVVNKVVRL